MLLADSTGWPEAARLAIGLSSAGSDVSALSPSRRHAVGKTRCVGRVFPYSGLRPLDSLVAAINATEPQLIIPCDDRAVQHLHELHAKSRRVGASGNDLAALIEKSLGSPESYPMACDRYGLLTIAREEGLRVPDTGPINSVTDLKSWQMRHSFPCVLKTDGTFGGHGVRIAHTSEQAEGFFLELTRYYRGARAIKRLCVNRDAFWLRPWWNGTKPGIIVQSYINGRPANCAVVCWKGKVLAGIGCRGGERRGANRPCNCGEIGGQPGYDAIRGTDRGPAESVWIHWSGFRDRVGHWSDLPHRNEPAAHAVISRPAWTGKRPDRGALRTTLRSAAPGGSSHYSKEDDRLLSGFVGLQ